MKQLKIFSLGLVGMLALLVAAPNAQAADVYQGEPSIKDSGPVEYYSPNTWTGVYVGGNLGAAFDDNGESIFIGGGHLGYNWQSPRNVVLGIEGDIDYADDIDYIASIRGRLGYSFGQTLAYATGGAIFIEDETGWLAGGGLEHKIKDNWSIGAEGLYNYFDDIDGDDFEFWTARARLTYHFGGNREVLK